MTQKISNLQHRNKKEKRFIALAIGSISFSVLFLILLISAIFYKGYNGFFVSKMQFDIPLEILQQPDANHREIIKNELKNIALKLNIDQPLELNKIYQLVSQISNLELQKTYLKNPKNHSFWLTASSKVDVYLKYNDANNLNENQLKFINYLKSSNLLKTKFNIDFFFNADSRQPEIAGIFSSLMGSLFMMLVFLVCAFPIAIFCAFYLEEFAKKNKFTDFIEISINNLAGIPSIIYGLLGLTLYLQIFHLPRSSTLVGGLTLFMLVLPVIIIATRNTIRTIPSSIRDGALAIGASKMQLIWHHLLPLSIPGIMTGTILAISRAIGETAPLLMIGMVAFIADAPSNFLDPASALSVQIYLWSDLPEQGFVEKTSAGIIVLIALLILLNLGAIILRKKFERKW